MLACYAHLLELILLSNPHSRQQIFIGVLGYGKRDPQRRSMDVVGLHLPGILTGLLLLPCVTGHMMILKETSYPQPPYPVANSEIRLVLPPNSNAKSRCHDHIGEAPFHSQGLLILHLSRTVYFKY